MSAVPKSVPAPVPDDTTDEADDAIESGQPPSPATISLTADAVRNSPEYREQAKVARREARQRGTVDAENARLRAELEQVRTAAEATARESQVEQIRGILGDEGVAAWDQIAELSTTDPVAAAREFAGFGQRMAQSRAAQAAADVGPATTPPAAPAGGTVPPAQLPNSGVSASAPLGQPAVDNSWDTIGAEAEARYQDVVKTVQGPVGGRNRITGRIRQAAIMDYLVSSVAKTLGLREKESSRR